jgi:hypothetical protein
LRFPYQRRKKLVILTMTTKEKLHNCNINYPLINVPFSQSNSDKAREGALKNNLLDSLFAS